MRMHYSVGFIFLPLWNQLNFFSQYKETCGVIIDYPTIGGEDIEYHVKKATFNLLHANIDVRSRILIDKFPGDGVKFISRIQYHCANMTSAEKSDMIVFFNKSHKKERGQKWNISIYLKYTGITLCIFLG